jgi:hypothetical protein
VSGVYGGVIGYVVTLKKRHVSLLYV